MDAKALYRHAFLLQTETLESLFREGATAVYRVCPATSNVDPRCTVDATDRRLAHSQTDPIQI
jgi:hypothetical protein